MESRRDAIKLLLGWPWIRFSKKTVSADVKKLAEDVEALKEFIQSKTLPTEVEALREFIQIKEEPQAPESVAVGAHMRSSPRRKHVAVRPFLWGVRGETKQDLADYANWARNAGEFHPVAYSAFVDMDNSPLADWTEAKRSQNLRYMVQLRLLQILNEGSYRGPKTAIFTGTLVSHQYTPAKLDSISHGLFARGIGKDH